MSTLPWELRKLAAQGRAQLAVAVCALGPVALALVLSVSSGLPRDTLFGSSVRDSGFALPLLVLGFAATWGLPLLASVLTGEVFAGEDAHGTWGQLVTRSRSRAELLTGKLLASALASVLLLGVLAVSSLLAGLALAGARPLVGLSGAALPASRAAELVVLSWASTVPPVLAFVLLAAVLSLASRSALVGVGGPVLLGLLLQLVSLVVGPVPLAVLLPTVPFTAWHALVRTDPYAGPLWQGALASLLWTALLVPAARVLLLRRDLG